MPNGRDPDFAARVLALMVFLLGIGLMLLVFVWAAKLFNELGVGKEIALQTNPSDRTPLAEWGIRWLMRVALLFVLGYIASLIAARGANFYLSTRSQQGRRGEQ
jgi:branched-subunit amino acid permease